MNLYSSIFRPLLFRMTPERAHEFSLAMLAAFSSCPSLLRWVFGSPARHPVNCVGLEFPNPVGLAAGMDKNAVALRAWEALGFGFVEAGTITALPQPGNPKPRLFRYPAHQVLVNRMGFNNDGCEVIAERLRRLFDSGKKPGIPIGLNLGKSKVTPLEEAPGDYLRSFQMLFEFGDYFVVNVSSPNTPGLRNLQAGGELAKILDGMRKWESAHAARGAKPVLVKLAPDLGDEELEEAVRLAVDSGASGFVATNTTLDRPVQAAGGDETGGLSGALLREKALAVFQKLRALTTLPLIASGGIMGAEDAAARRRAGADLLQLYTGFVYSGPALISQCCSTWQGPSAGEGAKDV